MRKGVTATQVIVALALGLIVIVGVGYLLWTWIGRGGGQVSEQYCRAKEVTYCVGCVPKGVDACDDFLTKNSDCGVFDWTSRVSYDTCKELLGQKETT